MKAPNLGDFFSSMSAHRSYRKGTRKLREKSSTLRAFGAGNIPLEVEEGMRGERIRKELIAGKKRLKG
jgi:hypothetical protein